MSEKRAPLHVGQLNLPSPDAFRAAFEDIFSRRHYANHGPLERSLDDSLAAYFQVRHAVSVVNGTAALILLMKALDVTGDVLTTAFTFPATSQSLLWAGLTPVFCDVDPDSHMLTEAIVDNAITPNTVAILGVHLWGDACDPLHLEQLARRRGLRLLFDAAHGTGCAFAGRRIGGFGDAEVFSFHATKVLNGAEGGCITTNDDALAARLRVMRSFHDGTGDSRGLQRFNAKMSEAQAAMTLLGLAEIDNLIAENRARYEGYRQGLAGIAGLRFVDHAAHGVSNYQYVVAEIDPPAFGMTRDGLRDMLERQGIYARSYFAPGVHRIPPFAGAAWHLPVTDTLCQSLIQFPTGQAVTLDDVASVCAAVGSSQTDRK